MNLLRFIELQNMNTQLHRLPIPIKLIPFFIAIIIPRLIPNKSLVMIIELSLIISCGLIISAYLRAPRYFLDIILTFLLLWIFLSILYLPSVHPILFFTVYIDQLIYWISIASTFVLFLSTTSVSQAENFLARLGIPYKYSRVLIVTYNLIPALYNEIKLITMTQKARGLQFSRNPLKRAVQMIAILMPSLFIALLRAEILEISIKSRGG